MFQKYSKKIRYERKDEVYEKWTCRSGQGMRSRAKEVKLSLGRRKNTQFAENGWDNSNVCKVSL